MELDFRERRLRMRALDERLTVRFPGMYRAIARRVMRLPAGSSVRRWLLARRTMAGYHAMNRGDLDVLLAIYDPNVLISFHPGGRMPPDLAGDYRGHDGFRELWSRWLASWQELRFEPEALVDLGDAILVTVTVRGRGRASGIETETRFFELFELRGGVVVRHQDFGDETAAVAASRASAGGERA